MSTILVLILFFTVSIFLMVLASIVFINLFVRKYIGEKHLVLDELTKGDIPKSWSGKYDKKCHKLKADGQQAKIERLKEKATKTYLKKLNQIVSYIQKTKLVENEETRSIILTDLEKTRNLWKENNAHES